MPLQSGSRRSLRRRLRSHLPRSLTFWSEGYGRRALLADGLAGLTVGVVALPLAMAFAIASGLTPERGLVTAVVAGFLISALSGSRYQIGGPTGAFVVVVYGIVAEHGYGGLQVATLMAGGMLLLMGLARLGAVIRFIPYPVITGFTSGIALIIFSSQVGEMLGLQTGALPAAFPAKWQAYALALHTVNPWAVAVTLASLGLILLCRWRWPRVPGPIVAIAAGGLAVWAFGLPVETIGSRFGGIPAALPSPAWPELSWEQARALVPDAFTIALLGAIESLLCAVVADGMTGDRHNSNTELLAQGAANVASAAFGGLPATGALARTATSVKAGARSPVAGIVHAATLLAIMLAAAPLARYIPLASLGAILAVVAWNMSEVDHFLSMFQAPRSDALVMVATFALTVLVDLTLAVQVGVVLASLLFMRRMVAVTEVAPLTGLTNGGGDEEGEEEAEPARPQRAPVPPGVEVYDINGPFFFGVADRLKDVLPNLEAAPRVFVLQLARVPAVDATGMHALDEFHGKCRRAGTTLVLAGLAPQPQAALQRSGLAARIGAANLAPDLDHALLRARELMAPASR